jgi:hypothetical protein
MMYPVHIRCHDKKPNHPVNGYGNMDVAVVEHGGGIESHFENESTAMAVGPSAATIMSLIPMEMTLSIG